MEILAEFLAGRRREMMKHVLAAGLMAAALGGPAWADDAADVKAAIEHHYKLFQGGDLDASVEQYHLDDFTMFPGDGGLLWESDFAAVAERMGADMPIAPRGLRMTDFRTQLYDDVAVVTFYLVGAIDSEPITNRVSAVWIKTADGWKEVHHHESRLQPGGTL